MSDKTPGSAEFDELAEDEAALAPDESGVEAVDATEVAVDDAETELDLQLDEPAAPVVASGVTRRTSKAPVRKKDLAAADDAAIAELEEGLEPDTITGSGADRKTAKAPVKKGVATRKQSDATHVEHDPYGPTNPATFVRQSAQELQKVVWPTWPQLVQYFLAVLVFVLFFIAFVGLLDYFFGWSLLQLFGDS